MANKYSNPFAASNSFESQQKFMEILAMFNQGSNSFGFPGKKSTRPDWADAMDIWWRTLKPAVSSQNENVMMKLIEQAKQYYFISEQFVNMYNLMSSTQKKNKDAIDGLNKTFEDITAFFMDQNASRFSWSSLIDQCEQPYELLKNTFADNPLFSSQGFTEFSPEWQKLRENFLTMPGLGYSRESQEKLQKAMRLWATYQDNYHEFQTVMSGLNHEALNLMRKKLIKMHKKGEQVESMRQIYSIWVASNEKVYSDFVFTEEYSELNAKLVNSLMAFRKESHGIIEDNLASMNLPTTKSINALEQRQHDLRKQIKNMEAELKQLSAQVRSINQKQFAKPTSANIRKVETTKKSGKRAKKKKTTFPTRAGVVDFKKSKRVKQKKNETAKKKTSLKDRGGMIELKF